MCSHFMLFFHLFFAGCAKVLSLSVDDLEERVGNISGNNLSFKTGFSLH